MFLILLAVPSVAAPPVAVEDVSQSGRYFNKIANVNLLADYVEVCFTGGAVLTDLHVGGGASAGGNCVPGTPGYLIELIPRVSQSWAGARATCVAEGMRLPEIFELLHVCENAVAFGFVSNADSEGWATNRVLFDTDPNTLIAVAIGNVGGSPCMPDFLTPTTSKEFLCAQ